MRWQRVPVVVPRGAGLSGRGARPRAAVADQSGGIRPRLAQLESTRATSHRRVTGAGTDVLRDLEALVDAVVLRYARWAHGNPTMLVHAATAPNAVLRTLPSLPVELWQPSYAAAWSASAAVIAAYRPSTDRDPDAAERRGRVRRNRRRGQRAHDKLADTALETSTAARTGTRYERSAQRSGSAPDLAPIEAR